MNLEIINEQDGTESIFMYLPKYIKDSNNHYLRMLNAFTNNDWKLGTYKHHELNRIQRFYSVDKKPFCEQWKNQPERWQPHVYEDWLIEMQYILQHDINDMCKDLMKTYTNFNTVKFNSALINKYRNGNDYIPEHRDIVVMNQDPTIVSISFGQSRVFKINRILYDPNDVRKLDRDVKNQHFSKSWTLHHGDLFLMAGSAQKYFSHEILPDNSTQPRYNITFR